MLKNSIDHFWAYIRERYGFKFVAVACYLALAHAGSQVITSAKFLMEIGLIYLLLFPFRLLDDLFDVAIDRHKTPLRYLCAQKNLQSFWILCGFGFSTNTLFLAVSGQEPRDGILYGVIAIIFYFFYARRGQSLNPMALIWQTAVLMKYPLLYLLLLTPATDLGSWEILLAMTSIFFSFNVYEYYHHRITRTWWHYIMPYSAFGISSLFFLQHIIN